MGHQQKRMDLLVMKNITRAAIIFIVGVFVFDFALVLVMIR